MAKDYKFSISVYIDNEELLPATIASITADKEFFRNSIQIVLIDSLVTKESTELCLKYTDDYPENIYFVDCQGENMAECFSDARVICTGAYVSFIRAGDEYSYEALKNLHLQKHLQYVLPQKLLNAEMVQFRIILVLRTEQSN